ncbi:MAG TPA: hypothetical protein VF498_08260 [Anaerolineales bacterium]
MVRTKPARTPFFVWLLLLGLLALGIFNALRLYGALRAWSFYQVIDLRPGVWYIALTGGLFAIAFLAALVMLLRGKRRAAAVVRVVALAYALWYWLDRLLFTRSDAGALNWPFAAGVTVILLVFVLLATAAWKE